MISGKIKGKIETVIKSQKEKTGLCMIRPSIKNQMEENNMKYVCDVCGWEYDE